MPIPITVPRLGWTMEEGVFEGWLKQQGESVQAGEPLFALEGEKATQDVEAVDSGILYIGPDAPKAGDVVPVGAVLAYLLSAGEPPPPQTAGTGAPANAREKLSDSPNQAAPAPAAVPLPSQRRTAGSDVDRNISRAGHSARRTISPRALRVAQELGVDWSRIPGTGRTGRIRERDVRAALDSTASPQALADVQASGRLIPLSPGRRTIASRMRSGLESTAPVTLTTEADATSLVQWRRRQKQDNAGVPSITDVIVKLSAMALEQHPMVMAQWTTHGILMPDGVHINLAIHTESGLVAPLIRDVSGLTLRAIADVTRSLGQLAHARHLTAEQLSSGTFTVSNLGMHGIDAFTPILNVPQSAILGVGRIRRVPAVVDDQIIARDRMTLSLTFDHRVLDGVPAAQFLDTLRQLIEDSSTLLAS